MCLCEISLSQPRIGLHSGWTRDAKIKDIYKGVMFRLIMFINNFAQNVPIEILRWAPLKLDYNKVKTVSIKAFKLI